jgi:hypothetical protein
MEAVIRIDHETYTIDADVASLEELQARLHSSMVRGDVDQLWLADGSRMSVNWRAVRRVTVLTQGGLTPNE